MSAGLIAVLIIAAVLLCVALGLIWWVNRPLTSDHAYARQTLPLFGSDVVIDAAPIDDEEFDGDDTPAGSDRNIADRPTQPTAATVSEALGAPEMSIERRAQRFAPPPGVTPVSSMQPPRAPERKQPSELPRTFSTVAENGNGARLTTQLPLPTRQSAVAAPQLQSAAAAAPVARVATVPALGSTYEGQALRFSIPTDGTLQFLPGRLEITAGHDMGREIRFVRFPGPNGSRVTFGRVEGPMYRHVQLHDQTVSRRHATMQMDGSSWMLTNLSTTNPVVHNERMLGEGEVQSLSDGDRIEMGEVVFRYRAR